MFRTVGTGSVSALMIDSSLRGAYSLMGEVKETPAHNRSHKSGKKSGGTGKVFREG